MCHMKAIIKPGTDARTFREEWMEHDEFQWVEAAYVTNVYGLAAALPSLYGTTPDGALSGFAEVVEGQCGFAIDEAEEKNGQGPYDRLVRYRIRLGEEVLLNRVAQPRRLKAFYFMLAPGERGSGDFMVEFFRALMRGGDSPFDSLEKSSEKVDPAITRRRQADTMSALRSVLPTATIAVPQDMDNGGKTYDGLWEEGEVHWVVKATVDSHAQAIALLEQVKAVPGVRLPFVLVEEESVEGQTNEPSGFHWPSMARIRSLLDV